MKNCSKALWGFAAQGEKNEVLGIFEKGGK